MKIKVLFVNHVTKIGGSEVSLSNLIRNLNTSNYDIFLLCPSEGMLTEELARYGIKFLYADLPLRFRRDNISEFVPQTYKLYKLLRTYKFDIIHANSYIAGYSIALVARILRVPLVTHVRDIIPDGFFIPKESKLLGFSKKLICISQAVKDHLAKYGFTNKTTVIPNGVDTSLFSATCGKARLPQNWRRIKFGLVGQVINWKGHEEFLDAISNVVGQGLYSDFYIIGDAMFNDPSYLDFLKEKARKLRISEFVHFISFQRDIVTWMNALDVVVCPSWFEPFGRVVIEGMSLKKLVIATNVGGPAEIIEDGKSGILVTPKDPKSLENAIVRCIKNPEIIEEFGIRARENILNKYTISIHVNAVEKLYKNILKLEKK